jgi:hypothetical protein
MVEHLIRTLCVAMVLASSARAANYYFKGVTNQSLSSSANFSSDPNTEIAPPAAPGPEDTLFFNMNGRNGDQIIHLAGNNRQFLGMVFRSTGTTQVNRASTDSSNANALSIRAGGITLEPSSGAVTFGKLDTQKVNMRAADSLTIANHSDSPLSFNRTWSSVAASGVTLLSIGGSGSGTVEFNEPIDDGAAALVALRINTAGRIVLRGSGGFSGGTTLVSGVLEIGNSNALGTGPLTIQGGTIRSIVSQRTLANSVTLGGNVIAGGAGASLAISGPFDLQAGNREITLANSLILDGVISNGGLIISGMGPNRSLALTGASNYTGPTEVNGITLLNAGTLGATDVTIAQQGALSGPGSLAGNALVLSGELSMEGLIAGSLTIEGAGVWSGFGPVGGPISIAGQHRPGASTPRTQNYGSITYQAGAELIWNLAKTPGEPTGFDQIEVDSLSFAGPAALGLTAADWSDPFWDFSRSFVLFSSSAPISGSHQLTLSAPTGWLDANGTAFSTVRNGTFTLAIEGTEILLNYVVGNPAIATITLGALSPLPFPKIGYNWGHFMPGTNAVDWWRYSGVKQVRVFLTPSEVESSDDLAPHGDGVTDQASFLDRRAALRADPLNPDYINWAYFNSRYENNTFLNNRFRLNYAFGELRKLGVEIKAQVTASESRLPILDHNDWAGKWELWQHYYAQAFYLARHFDVRRWAMFNEPNHPNANGLTVSNWLMRMRLASDAIQAATADVNALYGKALQPLVYAPVTAGSTGTYSGWGRPAVLGREVNFLGESNPLWRNFHHYAYQVYNSSPANFASEYLSLRSMLHADLPPGETMPMAITEFNVHTGATFDGLEETMDTPSKFARLGSIAVRLANAGIDELYLFKFAQTARAGGVYPVAKNGIHYVENESGSNFSYGGISQGGEVWRLFNRAFGPGRIRVLKTGNQAAGSLDTMASYDPVSGTYYVLSSNNNASAVSLSIDVTGLGIPQDNRVFIEEVSSSSRGGVARLTRVNGNKVTTFSQPGYSVWLYSIPSRPQHMSAPEVPTFVVPVSEGTSLADGVGRQAPGSGGFVHLVRHGPTSANDRRVTLLKFELPAIYPSDFDLAALSLEVAAEGGSWAQAHVYGLENNNWNASALTWATTSNLKQNVPAGPKIANNVVTGQGSSAKLLGQLVASSATPTERLINITEFLRSRTDRIATIMIVQDARWDVALPSLAEGDVQPGIMITSAAGAAAHGGTGPRLRIVRLQDSDGDGISDFAETTTFGTDPFNADSDGDGLADGDEILVHGTDPLNPDTDGDGFSDGEEIAAGTNPLDANSFPVSEPNFAGWARDSFSVIERLDPAVGGPLADPDGDGLANLLEYAFGLNPRSPDSAEGHPEPTIVDVGGESYLALRYRESKAAEGLEFKVEAADGLGNWLADAVLVEVNDRGDYRENVWRDSVPLSQAPRRFIRLRVNLEQ